MLVFDNTNDAESAVVAEKGSKYPASTTTASVKSQERPGALVADEENVAKEAKTRVGRWMNGVTAQLAQWGVEVNGCVL